MTKCLTKSALSLIALASIVALLHATPAPAASAKTWVSHNGNNGFTCASPNAACATFDVALAKTTPGGEIGVVDAGDYGTLSINQSVSITNDGAGEASVLVGPLGLGIVILAGAGDVVSLRGLVVDGQGIAAKGISIRQASAVHVQNCVIRNFEGAGFGFGIVLDTNVQLFVSDTVIFNNGSGTATGGIAILPFGAVGANVVLDHVHLENNVRGLWVDGSASTGSGAHVVIRDSVVSGNAGDGILATSAPGKAPAFVVVERTSSVNNAGTGIKADGPRATIVLNDDTVSRNGTGISAVNSGQLISFGNNKNFNNVGPEGAPTGFFSQM